MILFEGSCASGKEPAEGATFTKHQHCDDDQKETIILEVVLKHACYKRGIKGIRGHIKA